jgi:hypothetical protein
MPLKRVQQNVQQSGTKISAPLFLLMFLGESCEVAPRAGVNKYS